MFCPSLAATHIVSAVYFPSISRSFAKGLKILLAAHAAYRQKDLKLINVSPKDPLFGVIRVRGLFFRNGVQDLHQLLP